MGLFILISIPASSPGTIYLLINFRFKIEIAHLFPNFHLFLIKNHSTMEENRNTEQDANKKNSLLDKAEELAGKISEKAEEAWDKAKNSELADKAKVKLGELKEDAKHLYDQAKSGELTDKAKVKLEDLKEDAKHLYDQAKSGELADKAKVKLEGLKEDAKELWNKVVDKLDHEENKKTTPPQEDAK